MQPTDPAQPVSYPPGPGYPPPGPAVRPLRLGDLLAAVGGLIIFGFSFAPFISADDTSGTVDEDVRMWENAWAIETFMAPLTWFVIFAGLLLVGSALTRYLRRDDPQRLGFRLTQIELGLALFTLVVLFGMVTSSKHWLFGSGLRDALEDTEVITLGTGWGAILMLIGALAAAVGAFLTHLHTSPVIHPRPVVPAAPQWGGHPAPPPPPAQAAPPGSAGPPAPPGAPASGSPAPPHIPPASPAAGTSAPSQPNPAIPPQADPAAPPPTQ